MNTLQKFETITDWFKDFTKGHVSELIEQNQITRIHDIENLIGEKIPSDVVDIFNKYDGDDMSDFGSFLGYYFVTLNEIIQEFEYSNSMMKPEKPVVKDEKASNKILQAIIDTYLSEVPQKKMFGIFKNKWHKLVFNCSFGGVSNPVLYNTKQTDDKSRSILHLSNNNRKKIRELTTQLHKLEEKDFNWDVLKFIVYENGHQDIKRSFIDYNETLSFRNYPKDMVKIQYSNIKWLPIIKDGSGNFIGIDLDPASKGTKGQVINFGCDQCDIYVFADSWDSFLDLLLTKIEEEEEFKGFPGFESISKQDLIN